MLGESHTAPAKKWVETQSTASKQSCHPQNHNTTKPKPGICQPTLSIKSSPAPHTSKEEPSPSHHSAPVTQSSSTFDDRHRATFKAIRAIYDALHNADEGSAREHHLFRQLSEAYVDEDESTFGTFYHRLLEDAATGEGIV